MMIKTIKCPFYRLTLQSMRLSTDDRLRLTKKQRERENKSTYESNDAVSKTELHLQVTYLMRIFQVDLLKSECEFSI